MSRWPEMQLGGLSSVVTKGTTPTTLGYKFVSVGVPFLRAEDVNGGAADWTRVTHHVTAECHERLERSQLLPGDLLITIAGSVGRIGFVPENAPPLNCNQAVCLIRLDTSQILVEYASYVLQSPSVLAAFGRDGTTATITNLSLKQIREVVVPLPPLDEQRRIVDILKRADSIRRFRKQALETTRELIPALFVDMFGDPATNPKGWETQVLCEVSDIGSGVTKGRKLDGQETVELPYLSVANVQDGYLNLANVKTIQVKPAEIDRLNLQAGDLLMTEGGDPDKLGRCALWGGEITPCLHQNHVFRVRCYRTVVLPEYVRALAGSGYGKRYFLKVAKQTTGIASINKTQLSAFPVLVPPLDRQLEFERKCCDVRALIAQQQNHLIQAEAMQEALMAQFFS